MKTTAAEKIADPSYRIEKQRKSAPAFEVVDGGIMLARDAVAADGDEYHEGLSGASVTLPKLVAGTDYVICCTGDSLIAVAASAESFARPDVLGGFHYAPGGNAVGRAGGDDAPAINPCSIWDFGFRPACADPCGMAYVAGVPGSEHVVPFWADIYLLGVDQPMADRMAQLAPDDPNTPAPDLHTSIVVSPSLKNPVGRAEFAAVKAAGESNAEAVRALRDARRAAGGDYFAEIYVGPDAKVYYAHLVEFGTAHSSPEPYARPAFDETKKQVLDGIVNGLKPEIDKAIARVRARAANAMRTK